jgi:prepilin-type processing-associated H-X9-DG protein
MLQLAPAWTVANGYAVIGTNLAACEKAIPQATASGESRPSVTGTSGYKQATARLPDNLVSLSYADSRTQYTQMMTTLRQLWPMASMFAGQAGVNLPSTLPALDRIIQDMKPACQTRWLGPDGFYARYQGPGIEVSLSSVAGASLGAGILMPALARAREQARTAASMNNLKQIGLALIRYAQDNDGSFPPDLQAVGKYLGKSSVLESPHKPKDFTGPSYIYIPGQTMQGDMHNVLVYENPEFLKDKVNVLFPDGHVEAMKPKAFRQVLETTCERLDRPMPAIKFKGETGVPPHAPAHVGKATPSAAKPAGASS